MSMTQKLRRLGTLFLASLVLCTVIMSATPPQQVLAAPYSKDSIEQRSKAWLYGRAIGLCFRLETLNDGFVNSDLISEDHAKNGEWFYNDPVQTPTHNVGTVIGEDAEGDPDDGQMECSNSSLVTKGLEALGLEPIDALCSMGVFKREHAGSTAGDTCKTGSGHFDTDVEKSDAIQNAWNKVFRDKYLEGKDIKGALTDGMRYWISLETFRLGCRADFVRVYDGQDVSGDKKYKTPLYNADTDKIEQWYVETQDGNDDIDVGGNTYFDDNNKQFCATLEGNLDKYIDNYIAEIKENKKNGIEENVAGSGDDNSGSDTNPSCWSESGPLAWLLCAALEVVDGAITFLDTAINNLLFVDNERYNDDGVRQSWAVMRNIALLILVPMMMFMVIGTALEFGPFDPYTVKKALPRMLVAVIFIVLSLPITQFGVQLSNVVGQGIGNLIVGASSTSINSLGDILGRRGTNDTFGGLITLGGAAAVATASLTIGIVGSFALVALGALLIGFVVLVMRQVLLVMLIVIAPLAILAWIFPGNDKLWGIWKGTFIAMLLLYPIISVLIASGKFVAGIFG